MTVPGDREPRHHHRRHRNPGTNPGVVQVTCLPQSERLKPGGSAALRAGSIRGQPDAEAAKAAEGGREEESDA